LATYVQLTWKNFWKAEPYTFLLYNDGAELSVQAFFISLANSNQFGNNVTIAPKARLNDGKLDVVIVTGMSKFKLIRSLFQQLTKGDIQESLYKERDIRYLQTSHIRIRNLQNAPLHLDGDPYPAEEIIEVKVLPASFKLMVPTAT
jgi:diacylglycerol kinase (ATP)